MKNITLVNVCYQFNIIHVDSIKNSDIYILILCVCVICICEQIVIWQQAEKNGTFLCQCADNLRGLKNKVKDALLRFAYQ